MNIEVYETAQKSTVWRDLSHFGRFSCRGKDAGALLHHLTTNDIKGLKPDTACEAVLVTSKARILDWVTVLRNTDGYLVVTSPNRRTMFAPHAHKFVLFRQEISIDDVTEQGAMIGLFGPGVAATAAAWGLETAFTAPDSVVTAQIQGIEISAVQTHRLPGAGFLVWCEDAAGLRRLAGELGAPVDDATYNVLRVEAGVPVTGLELTEEINPWEANLDTYISLHKGCYNGQEVVARLHTYQKVKQHLSGLQIETAVPLGTNVALQDETGKNAGFMTSSVESPRLGAIALGYVRNDFYEPGRQLRAGIDGQEQTVTVSPLPFGSRS